MRFHFLDGLRAIAVLLIVAHHSVTGFLIQILDALQLESVGIFLSYFTQSGVELFFTLSGVVLLRPYLRSDRKMDIAKYFKRRISRIYPTYFVAVLFAALVIFFNTFYATWYSDILVRFNLVSFFEQFLIFNQSWTYYNLAWWSLQLEIAFYVFVPIICYFMMRRKIALGFVANFLIVFSICICLQLVFAELFPNKYSTAKVYVNLYRMVDYLPCFYFGVCLAKKDYSKSDILLAAVVGIVLISCAVLYSPFAHMGYALLYFALIGMLFSSSKWQEWFSKENLVWLGERSFSLFLVHFSVFYLVNYIVSFFVAERNIVYGVLTRGFGIPLAIIIAMILFWFVEKPFARGLTSGNLFLPPLFYGKKIN